MNIKSIYIILALAISNLVNAEVCELPDQFKGKIDTFIIKPEVSCGANIFINTMPLSLGAKAKLAKKDQNNLALLGRVAYEELSDMFEKSKIDIKIEEIKIKNRDKKDINLRHYTGTDTKKIIMYVHGGGWSRGSLKTHDQLCREISKRTGYSVFAVDYRLAPENPYPAGLNDVEDAFEWVLENKGKNVKVLVSGDSAGGNLSTALAIKRIEAQQKAPDGLLLLYPALDLQIPEKTEDRNADGYFLTRSSVNNYIKGYLGKDFKEQAKNQKVSPILASSETLKALPPTLIIAAEFDPLTAYSKEFTEKAKAAGAKNINFELAEKTIHIFAQYPDLFKEAEQALDLLARTAKDF